VEALHGGEIQAQQFDMIPDGHDPGRLGGG
jgi:hypothetical protein